MKHKGLSVLSVGGGQDSATCLALLHHDKSFRDRYLGNRDFLAVMCDTADEHEMTMRYVLDLKKLCRERGVPFFHLTGDQKYHTGHWAGGLHAQWEAGSTCGSVAFPAVCSQRLKQEPIYNFLADYVRKTYGYAGPGKKTLEQFAAERGKIEVWIGFTRGEEHRVPGFAAQPTFAFAKEPDPRPRWRRNSIELRFPLIELGYNRADCQKYLLSVGDIVPWPSLCFSCMYKTPIEILWTARRFPERFAKWVAAERRKLDAWANEDFRRARQKPEKFKPNSEYKNLGVAGRGSFVNGVFIAVTLLDTLREAERRYGHMSLEELDDFAFSHGHCVKSKIT